MNLDSIEKFIFYAIGLIVVLFLITGTVFGVNNYVVEEEIHDCSYYANSSRNETPSKCFGDFIPNMIDSGVK